MKKSASRLAVALLGLVLAAPVLADPGHGRGHDHDGPGRGGPGWKGERVEVFWDGHCKVERHWRHNGKFYDERRCQGPRYVSPPPQPVYQAPPAVVVPAPAVVIQPPPIIIK
ncbi:MAG: hypothetical protein LWW92_04465 [Rhodocyclales bacterium]|nr:hypothetical protein [Rhodocyclales bacterium]